MDYGITDTGFNRKRLNEILASKNAGTISVFGEDINLAPQSPDGQINGLAALSDDQLWQIAELAYDATDPDKAVGDALSSLVKLNYITRQEEKASFVVLEGFSAAGVFLPAGQLVSVPGGSVRVRTRDGVTIPAGGSALIEADCTVAGPISIAAGLLTNIDTPVVGWDSVTNPSPAVAGRYRETDGQLRLRRARSVGTRSQGMVDSLRGRVGDVDGVLYLNVLDNKTDTTDSNGLTPHSFEVIVTGGEPNAIAQAIWDTMPFGIGWQGNTTASAIDAQGIVQTVPFTRPVDVPIYMILNLHKRSDYPADGDTRIKEAIVSFAEGDLINGRGYTTGDDVIFTELYAPANVVEGMDIVSMFIGTAPAPAGAANIPIAIRETARFSTSRITINSV